MMALRRRRRCMRALAVVVVSVLIEMSTADQLVNCSVDKTWMDNESGESPCTVAYFLMLQCVAGEPEFAILPLNSSVRSYDNPLEGQPCTCNTVVYNLMSACAVCQDGLPTDYMTWTDRCSDVTYDYPNKAIARSYRTPEWAYVNITNLGSFNLEAAEEVAGVKKGWSTMQIALPVIIGVVVALIAGVIFFFYRRRLKRRYSPIADPYPSRPSHILQDSRSDSQQSIPQSRPGHHHVTSSSSLGLNSVLGRSSPAPKRKKSAAAVAWERAKMQAPRKLGGLLPDRAKVHERTRGADWSIDVDPGDPEAYYDPWHSRQGSSSSSGARSGLHSKEVSGDSQRVKEANTSHTSHSRPSGHGRSESQLGLLADTSPERFSPKRNSPGVNREQPTTRIVRRMLSGIGDVGVALGMRPRPVAVVSRTSRRGFNVDDIDSASSPAVLTNPRESRHESFVFAEREADLEAEAEAEVTAIPARSPRSLNLMAIGESMSSQNPSQSGSSGNGARSDGSGDAIASGSRSASRERAGRGNVLLISRSPGQDFNSMASPITAEEVSGLGPFSASTESENWPAALTDTSSVLSPSFPRPRQVALPLPPAPPPTSQTYSRTNSPSHSAPGTPRPPSRILIPHGNGSSQLLVPSSVRAAGGYTNPSQQPVPSATLTPEPLTSTTSLNNSAILPNARLFSGSIAESNVPEPPSAVSPLTAVTATETAVGTASEHSSSHAYTVPNPFTFDERHGGSHGAADALRMASPPRSRLRAEIIE